VQQTDSAVSLGWRILDGFYC